MLRYLETDSTDPAYNLAFEELVLERRREGDYLLLWQNAPTAVIFNLGLTEITVARTSPSGRPRARRLLHSNRREPLPLFPSLP